MAKDRPYIWIDVYGMRRETKLAILYETDEGEIWFPKSQVGAHATDKDGKHIRLEVTQWIAEQKGLIEA